MKRICFFLLFLLCASCRREQDITQRPSVALSILGDVTDRVRLKPTVFPALEALDFLHNPDQECLIRLRVISDKLLTPVCSAHIPSERDMERENIEDDKQFRAKHVVAFYGEAKKQFKDFYSGVDTTTTIAHSLCFQTIADELNFLYRSSYKKRVIVIYSNLFENSSLCNVYTSLTQHVLFKTPDAIAQKLTASHLLPNSLAGIKIIFVFEPTSMAEDKLFNSIVGVYKKLLESKGGIVQVQASNHFEL